MNHGVGLITRIVDIDSVVLREGREHERLIRGGMEPLAATVRSLRWA